MGHSRRPWQAARPWSAKVRDTVRGVVRAVRSQSSFAVHLPAAAAVVAAGLFVGCGPLEWALLAIAIGGVLAAELFNTAIESLARAIGVGRHPRIRDALDMAGGAVLLASLAAAVVGVIVLGGRAARLAGLLD